ncbi:MAG: hypothetical protein AB9869_08275 [Verrucomicrobiia bacterium]
MNQFTLNRRFPLISRILAGVFTIGFTGVADSNDSANLSWPNWRGPDANGSIRTGKYPTRWEAEPGVVESGLAWQRYFDTHRSGRPHLPHGADRRTRRRDGIQP